MTADRIHFDLSTVEVLIEIEQVEQVILSFELRILLIQFDQISGGAGAVFLNEANVVLFLELEHFVFAVAQIFFDLNQLLGNASGNFVAAVCTHPAFEIEILLHGRVEIRLSVLGFATDGGKIENRSARFLENKNIDRYRLKLGMRRTNERLRAVPHFRALHQLNLRAVKINAVFAVHCALRDVEFAGKHHLAGRLILRRGLINQKRFDK